MNISKWQYVRDRQYPYNTDPYLQKGSFPWRDLVDAGNALADEVKALRKENEQLREEIQALLEELGGAYLGTLDLDERTTI